MAYQFKQEVLYERALFSFINDSQDINVAFEPIKPEKYLMIIFADDGNTIQNHHSDEFIDTLNDILTKFDDNQNFDYDVVAV